MPLETATYIHELNTANPLGSDPIASGDDHLRLIKAALKATFPNITGPISVTQSDLNSKVPNAIQKDGSVAMTGALTLSGNASSALQAVPKQQLDAGLAIAMPTGGIIIWSGASNAIPSGWALCNGSSGTPDLRDRFVVGAGSTYAVGATGGSKDAIVVSHSHTATVSTASLTGNVTGIAESFASGGGAASGVFTKLDGYTVSSTPVQNDAGSGAGFSMDASHTHTVTVASTGSSGTNANLPPYYALAYIMKV